MLTEAQQELVKKLREGCISLLGLAQDIEDDNQKITNEEISDWIEADIRYFQRALSAYHDND